MNELATSQQALRASIARSVAEGLPLAGTPADLNASIEDTVLAEARANERMLAGLRAIFLSMLAIAGVGLWGWLDPLNAQFLPGRSAALLAVLALAAILLSWALWRGWYDRRLRRVMPVCDAAAIALVIASLLGQAGPAGQLSGEVAGVTATACLFLAFSGSLRLSRTATTLATSLALVDWTLLALVARLRLLEYGFIAAAIVAAGALGGRMGRLARRVVTHQVARARLMGLYDEARHAIEAREEVLRIVSHDLRNPLNNIGLATDMLLEMEASREDQVKSLHAIRRAGERMDHLIQDLLDVARLEAGTLSVEPKPVALAQLFEQASEANAALAAARGIGFSVIGAEDSPVLHVDAERIQQVFANLIGNAIKFTPRGGHVTVRAQRMGEKVRVMVEDTGPGIPAERLESVFGQFWQADRSDRRGIGLGLTIARAIVEAHGERIGVDSRPGEGSVFWFTTTAVR